MCIFIPSLTPDLFIDPDTKNASVVEASVAKATSRYSSKARPKEDSEARPREGSEARPKEGSEARPWQTAPEWRSIVTLLDKMTLKKA